jgi:DNA mismatch repair protein MutL
VQAAVKQSIGQYSLTPTIDFDVDPGIEAILQQPPGKDIKQPGITVDPDYNPFSKSSSKSRQSPPGKHHNSQWEKIFEDSSSKQVPGSQAVIPEKKSDLLVTSTDPLKFFQLHNRYIICNVKEGMMVIDQQKAHERILYEQYLDQLSGGSQSSQQQLFPHHIHLSPGDTEIIRSLIPELSKLGFLFEPFGSNGFVINGIPSNMPETDIDAVLERIIENHKQRAKNLDFDKNVILARSMSVNTSIKPGTLLTQEEMADIFSRLFACDIPEISPDGKKIVNVVSLADIEKIMKK